MDKKKKDEIKIKEMAIIMIPLPDSLVGKFVNLVRGILSVTEDESYNYRRFPGDNSVYVAIQIHPDKKFRLYQLLSAFSEANDLVFEKPNLLRPKEEIQQACTKAQRAVDVAQKEVNRLIPGPLHKKEIARKRLAIDQGVLHALSWVLNQEGIGEIAPV